MTYIDIETVPAFKTFKDADDRTRQLFKAKFRLQIEEELKQSGTTEDEIAYWLWEKAGTLAEFNKIVCVSLGTVLDSGSLYIKSFFGHDEKEILVNLNTALLKCYTLCAHFGKGFDYPVLARKYIIHGLPIPHLLNTSGMKPWEIPLHDTQEMWKFGDMRHSCSLDLLAHCFGLPSPKEEMHGSEVAHYYYNVEYGLEKIVKYCEADVRTLANVYRRMVGQEMIGV